MEDTAFREPRSGIQGFMQLFQNLIRKKIMRIEEEQVFTKVDVIEKHSQLKEGGLEIYERGEEVLRQKKGRCFSIKLDSSFLWAALRPRGKRPSIKNSTR